MGVDLVQAQLRLAAGESLADLGLGGDPPVHGFAVHGFAVQARVNLETIAGDGTVRPTGGVLRIFEPATGPGVRTDTYASTGYQTNPAFDSLLAKVIGHAASSDVSDAIDRTRRALRELRSDRGRDQRRLPRGSARAPGRARRCRDDRLRRSGTSPISWNGRTRSSRYPLRCRPGRVRSSTRATRSRCSCTASRPRCLATRLCQAVDVDRRSWLRSKGPSSA